jgi:hypothetical protein
LDEDDPVVLTQQVLIGVSLDFQSKADRLIEAAINILAALKLDHSALIDYQQQLERRKHKGCVCTSGGCVSTTGKYSEKCSCHARGERCSSQCMCRSGSSCKIPSKRAREIESVTNHPFTRIILSLTSPTFV